MGDCKMTESSGRSSNAEPSGTSAAGQLFGRPVGAQHEVRQREIKGSGGEPWRNFKL